MPIIWTTKVCAEHPDARLTERVDTFWHHVWRSSDAGPHPPMEDEGGSASLTPHDRTQTNPGRLSDEVTRSSVLAMTFLRAVLRCVADYLWRASTASRKRAYARPCPREV